MNGASVSTLRHRTQFDAYLGCRGPEKWFAWLECTDCAHHRLVLFSCKTRGFCPSCAGRRMAETSAHWVDRVIPWVATRQWVLTVPWSASPSQAVEVRPPGPAADLAMGCGSCLFTVIGSGGVITVLVVSFVGTPAALTATRDNSGISWTLGILAFVATLIALGRARAAGQDSWGRRLRMSAVALAFGLAILCCSAAVIPNIAAMQRKAAAAAHAGQSPAPVTTP